MSKEDIIRMAREAGLGGVDNFEPVERFAELVRKDYSTTHANIWLDRIHKFMLVEREACAKECKFGRSSADIEQAIRARSNT